MQLTNHFCMQANRKMPSLPIPVSLQAMYCQASRSDPILQMLRCCTSSAEGMAAAPLLCMPQTDPAISVGMCTVWCCCCPWQLLHQTVCSLECTVSFIKDGPFNQSSWASTWFHRSQSWSSGGHAGAGSLLGPATPDAALASTTVEGPSRSSGCSAKAELCQEALLLRDQLAGEAVLACVGC